MVPPVPEYAAILASPIFAPDRRPGAPEGSSGNGAGSLSGYAAIGAVAGGGSATAVITVPGGGIKTLRRGEEVDGWRLVGVDRTQAYFEHNGVRHALVIGAPPMAPTGPPATAAGPETPSPADTTDNPPPATNP
jgi:general secretion pathway protein N